MKRLVLLLLLPAIAFAGTTRPPPRPVTAKISASPMTVAAGGVSALTWNSTGASSCVLSASGQSQAVASSGSLAVPIPATTTVRVDCGTASATVTVTVGTAPPPPGAVNCVVSAWGQWTAGPAGFETRTRTVVTPASNGGTACPSLSEQRAVGEPPPPPSTGALPATGSGVRYDVCATCTYKELTTVPWNALTAGSVVNIYYRAELFRTKFVIRSQGTLTNPIIINGVPDADGNRPKISGDGAVTATASRNGYAGDENLALILIRRSTSDPWTHKAKFIVIQNLEVLDTYGKRYSNASGTSVAFSNDASGIRADVVEDLSIINVKVTGHGFGIFVNNRNAENMVDDQTSKRITVRRSQIFDNGVVGQYYQHNLYLQGIGCTIEDSTIGKLRAGALGSSYKSRCADEKVLRNIVTCAERCLDMVHDESGTSGKRDSPTNTSPNYDIALVEGNTINSAGNSDQCVHFGGDNLGEGAGNWPQYRRGPLTYRNNVCTLRGAGVAVELSQNATSALLEGNTLNTGGAGAWKGQFGTATIGAGNRLNP